MNYNGPKVRIARKLDIETVPKASKYKQRKPYPPGQHGPTKRRAKQSDYGRQLLEKQRLRLQYNVSEKQMRNYYKKASHFTGNTGDILMQLLETRLDSLVHRSGLAKTMYAARQFVSHGHILVNGRRVNVSSYRVDVNDVISIKPKSRKMECFQDAIRGASTVPYLELSKADFSATLLHIPTREEIPAICEISLVVEYYSR